MKKEYPLYRVLTHVFNPAQVELGNGHDLIVLGEFDTMDKAMDVLKSIEITDKLPEARLEIDYGEDVDTLWTKDEYGLCAVY